jgi:type II secretory pathway pseudopilin PulG
VIAILAILAAILFPVLSRAREQARKSVCTSNLRQHGQALTMYLQDYDETFPVATFSDMVYGYPPPVHRDGSGHPVSLVHATQPYVKDRGVFFCPTLRGQPNRAAVYPTDYNFLCVHGWSLLPGFTDFNNDAQGVCSHSLASIGRVAEKPMVVCDGLGEHMGETTQRVYNGGRPGGPVGAQNICYVDGHVKLTPGTYEAIVALYKAPNN